MLDFRREEKARMCGDHWLKRMRNGLWPRLKPRKGLPPDLGTERVGGEEVALLWQAVSPQKTVHRRPSRWRGLRDASSRQNCVHTSDGMNLSNLLYPTLRITAFSIKSHVGACMHCIGGATLLEFPDGDDDGNEGIPCQPPTDLVGLKPLIGACTLAGGIDVVELLDLGPNVLHRRVDHVGGCRGCSVNRHCRSAPPSRPASPALSPPGQSPRLFAPIASTVLQRGHDPKQHRGCPRLPLDNLVLKFRVESLVWKRSCQTRSPQRRDRFWKQTISNRFWSNVASCEPHS